MNALKLTAVGVLFLVGGLADSPFIQEGYNPPIVPNIGTAISIESPTLEPFVLDMGVFGCDGLAIQTFADGLITKGWRADLADDYGEALASPDGRVVVTFQC